jgi:ligand-binding sensor domain-containing protein
VFYNIVQSGRALFAVDGTGVLRSVDNGMSWTHLTGLPTGEYKALADVNGDLFVGDQFENGVLASSDYGSTWASRDSGLTYAPGENRLIFAFLNRGPGIFAGTDKGVYVTIDMGAHWSAANNGLTPAFTYCLGAAGSRLFAGTISGAYVSGDEGGHWSPADSNMTDNRVLPGQVLPVVTIATDDRRIFAGTSGAQIFRSTNYGSSWVNISNGLPVYGQSGVSLALSGSRLFAGYDAGVYASADYGDTWTSWTDNLSNHVVVSLSIAGGYLFVTTNDGIVWRRGL